MSNPWWELPGPVFSFTFRFTLFDRERMDEAIQEIRNIMEHDWDEEDFAEFEKIVQTDKDKIEQLVWWRGSLAESRGLIEWNQMGLNCNMEPV